LTDKPHIREIEKYFKEHGIKSKTFKLSPAETIVDPEKFVEGHLAILKSGNKRLYPYYYRLLKFYKHETIERDKGKFQPPKS